METDLIFMISIGCAIGMNTHPYYMGPLLIALYTGVMIYSVIEKIKRPVTNRRQIAFWFGLACFVGSALVTRWPQDNLEYVLFFQMGCYLAVF
jgi:hypothetical protein